MSTKKHTDHESFINGTSGGSPCGNIIARRKRSGLSHLAAVALLALAASHLAQAVDTTTTSWIGGDVGNPSNWGNATNWTGAGAVPGGPNSATLSVKFDSNATNYLTNIGSAKIAQGVWLADGVGGDVTINASVTSANLTITGTATLNSQTNAGIYMNDSANHNLTIGPKASILLSNNTGFYNQQAASTLAISGGLNLNGKTLTIGLGASSTGNVAISGNITSASGGAITINSAGTVTLNGTNTYSGGTTISNGILSFANGSLGSTGAITVNGGTLQWNGSNTQDISSRLTLQNGGAATLDTNGNNATLGTAFGGSTSSSLTKTGAGTLTLSKGNTYTGGTIINTGTISATFDAAQTSGTQTSGSLGVGGAITINSGGVLTGSINNWLDDTSTTANLHTVTIEAGGKLTNTATVITKLGAVTLNGGTWEVGAGFTYTGWNAAYYLGGNITVGGTTPSQITVASGSPTNANLLLAANRTITVDNTTSAIGLTVSAPITSNANNYGITKAGAGNLTLSGANTYTGVTTISAGTLVLSGGGTINSSSEINLGTLASQGTLDLTAKASGATIGAAQTLSGYGNVLMAAGQTLTVSGTLAPGNSAGIVTVSGNLTLGGGTSLELIDNTLAAGIGYDQVSLTGATPVLTYGGTLTLNIIGSPQSGTYHLFTGFNTQSGTFSAINYSAGGYSGTFDYATGDLTLDVVPEPATWALLAGGLVLAAGFRRRMRGQA